MSTTRPSLADWSPCPAGKLRALSASLRRWHAVNRVLQAGGAGTAALGAVLLVVWLVPPADVPRRTGVTCLDVRELAADFLAGTINEDVADHIRSHLRHCPECRNVVSRVMRSHRAAAKPPSTCPLCHTRAEECRPAACEKPPVCKPNPQGT